MPAGAVAALAGAAVYALFGFLLGSEASLLGIPVGFGIGVLLGRMCGRKGGPALSFVAATAAFVAFDLTYAPGMAGIFFRHGVTLSTTEGFLLFTIGDPLFDRYDYLVGKLMVVCGIALVWYFAGKRRIEPPAL